MTEALYQGSDNKCSSFKENGGPNMSPTGKGQKLLLVIFLICRFCLSAFGSLMAPFYPLLAAERGMDKPTIGVVFSCFQMASLITATAFGSLISPIEHKFMFVTGLFVTGACSILFGFLERCPPGAPFIGLSIAIRSIEGAGSTVVNVVTFAILTGVFPERVAFLSGLGTTVRQIGLTTGPAIGGFLFQVGGFGIPFWSFGILLLWVGCLAFFLPYTVNVNERSGTNEDKREVSYRTLLSEPIVVIMLSFMFTNSICITFLNTTLSLHLKEQFQLEADSSSIIFVLMTLCFACFALIVGRLGDSKIPHWPFLISGYCVVGVGLLFVGPVPLIPL